MRSLISMETGEKPEVIYSIYRDTDAKFVVFVSKQGYVKRTDLNEYIGAKKKTGIKALGLHDNDSIASVFLANNEDILIISKDGYLIRCKGIDFPASGRITKGVKGISLHPGDEVIVALPVRDVNDSIALFSKNGFARRLKLSAFPAQTRNGRGTICAKEANIPIKGVSGESLGSIFAALLAYGYNSEEILELFLKYNKVITSVKID